MPDHSPASRPKRDLTKSNARFQRAVTLLNARGIVQSYTGHPSMFGLFFADKAPDTYRDCKTSDDTFHDTVAYPLHDLGVIVEPDSRKPWFLCEAHGLDPASLTGTLKAVDLTLEQSK